MVDNFINNYSNLTDEPTFDTNFVAKLDGFIKYLKIVKKNVMENKVSTKSINLIDQTITDYYDNSIKMDNYESSNYLSIAEISDEETSSIDSNDVEFVDSSENEENDPQIKQFDFLNSNTYNSYPQNNFNYEKKTEPVKIDENIEQKKINFDYYKFYENNMDLEKRYKKYIENCFKY